MCNICGQPKCSNPQYCKSRQPYCDQCVEDTRCVSPIDTQCIIYHFNTNTPTKLINLNFPNGTNLEVILEKIDALVGGINIPFSPQDTLTVKWVPGGVGGHAPRADVRISSQLNNHLTAKLDGLYVEPFNAEYKVRVDANDTPDYLVNQITGGTDGVVTNSITNDNGLLAIRPKLDILAMFQKIRDFYADDFCDLVSSCQTQHPSPSGCTPVSFGPSNVLPDGIVGQPYSYEIQVVGSQPLVLSDIIKPSWMNIVAGFNNIVINGTPDVAGNSIPVSFTVNNCTGSTQAFDSTVTITATTPNPNPITGRFKILCSINGNCYGAGNAGFQFIFDQPLAADLTMKIAIVNKSNVSTRLKLGYDLIPAVAGQNYYAAPFVLTIPAGTTSYSTLGVLVPYNGLWYCSTYCSGQGDNDIFTREMYVQLQSPNDGLTISMTNIVDAINPNITFTQVP